MAKRVGVGLFFGALAVFCGGASTRAQQAQISPDLYNEMKFRYIGPVGNRATAVAGIPGNPNVYYVGAASGGIFKSTDGGIHWDPSLTRNLFLRLDRLGLPRVTRTSCGREPGNRSFAATFPLAMGFTSRWTQGRPGS